MSASILEALWLNLSRVFDTFLKILGLYQPKDNMHKLQINVKFNSRPCIVVDTDPKWSVSEFKERLSSKIGVPSSDIKLIFAGRELQGSILIEDFDLGNQSIIHAVRSLKPSAVTVQAESYASLAESILTSPSDAYEATTTKSPDAPKRQAGFFVYCSTPCRGIQRGKLRVRCTICKQGTLTVSQDPCCWEDVLQPGRISGVCQSENCQGNTAEFFFKCANHPSVEDDYCVALYLIRSNVNDVTCLACTDVKDSVVVFQCEDAHVMCLECFHTYCNVRLNERQFVQDAEFGYTLPCPAGCENSLIKETHHFRVLDEEQYSRYQRFGTEECVLQAGGVLCPVPGCGAGLLPDLDCRRVVCVQQGAQGCGFVFCRNCLQGFHLGDCQENNCVAEGSTVAFTIDPSQACNARWDAGGTSAVQVITKPCPNCRTPTERDGGCMHMVCTRPQCGFHWCWVCQTEWTRECMGSHWFG